MDKFKPDYYKTGGIDVIEFCQRQELSYTIGNIIKYVVRAGRKGSETALDDLKKAREYIDREIAFMEQNGEKDDCADIKAVPVEELESVDRPVTYLDKLIEYTDDVHQYIALSEAAENCPHDYGWADFCGGACRSNCVECWLRPYEEAKHD